LPEGIIIKGIGGFYYIESNDDIFCCKAKGLFRKKNIKPLPGDVVSFDIVDKEKKEGFITVIQNRRNELLRPEVANINQVILMISIKAPGPDLYLLDKLLITASAKDIVPIICINKIDLDEENIEGEIIKDYKPSGFKLYNISALNDLGTEKIKSKLKNKITVLAGQSGVGKSTLLNKIMKENVMETGDISRKTDRGKHTTRHAELIKLKSGGYIIDTPGFSNFELDGNDSFLIKDYYPEFYDYQEDCRFSTCVHINEPDCAVKKAVELKKIGQGRYKRYKYIYKEVNERKKY
jgi:ribosome biogenesis GTPase